MTDPTPQTPNPARTCANCACYTLMAPDGSILEKSDNLPHGTMTVCRLRPPGARPVRVELPMTDREGKPLLRRDGSPQTQAREVMQIGYPATVPSATCFEGWRALGTVPGSRQESAPPAAAPPVTDFQRIPDGT